MRALAQAHAEDHANLVTDLQQAGLEASLDSCEPSWPSLKAVLHLHQCWILLTILQRFQNALPADILPLLIKACESDRDRKVWS